MLDPISLTEIARLLPEVLVTHPRLSPPTAMTEGWQRQHFFAALTRAVLSARQPLLLLLDDLHWCDHETLEWLQYLFHFAPDAHLLLIGTMRAEEITSSHPLTAFLGTLQRNGLVSEIPLERLTMTETVSLAEDIMGKKLDSAMSNALYQETEGNPFFVVEMGRAGTVKQGATIHPELQSSHPRLSHTASPLPPSVQVVLATRLAQLSTLAHDLANVAAIIGREFSFSVLAHASGEDEEKVVQGLDELWQRRIVREHDTGMINAYDFSHDKLRQQLSASLSSARRRLLHQRVAEAFKAVYGEDQDTICGQIAAHYEQADVDVESQAVSLALTLPPQVMRLMSRSAGSKMKVVRTAPGVLMRKGRMTRRRSRKTISSPVTGRKKSCRLVNSTPGTMKKTTIDTDFSPIQIRRPRTSRRGRNSQDCTLCAALRGPGSSVETEEKASLKQLPVLLTHNRYLIL